MASSPAAADAPTPAAASVPGWLDRIGLAVAAPRWALAVADDPRSSGRAGSDVLLLLLVLVAVVHTRGLVAAGWLAAIVDPGAGGRGLLTVLSGAATTPLAFLVVGALAVWLTAGPRRSLGRDFDLACVAVVPLMLVELAVTLPVRAFDLAPGGLLTAMTTGVAFAWSGSLLALAWRQARTRRLTAPEATS